MSDDYDIRLKQTQDRNNFILGHLVHTWRGRVSDDTLYQHIHNIEHFANSYLNYSADADELRSIEQATAYNVYDFITDWLPRKSLVDSASRIRSYLASFNKLFRFMGEQDYMPAESAATILEMLQEDRQEMIEVAVSYYDEPDESLSPEAFQAGLQDLVERWRAIHSKPENGSIIPAED